MAYIFMFDCSADGSWATFRDPLLRGIRTLCTQGARIDHQLLALDAAFDVGLGLVRESRSVLHLETTSLAPPF